MKKLRFAPIIRVSTEKQAQKGESLRTQKKQIEEAVNKIGGMIPDYCWKYCGQESATTGEERQRFDMLLKDSENDIFDAVIVTDLSRWSRETRKSENGLYILRENNIRFFVLTDEYALNDPTRHYLFSSQINVHTLSAGLNRRKSLDNKIERAKRGIPVVGKIPYGRTWKWDDKRQENGHWEWDKDIKTTMVEAAERYLHGEKPLNIALDLKARGLFNLHPESLRRTLRDYCGNAWTVTIDGQAIKYKIPPLLNNDTIQRIHDKLKFNGRHNRKDVEKYPLHGFIYCANCHCALGGNTSAEGNRHYQHKGGKLETCEKRSGIRADMIENAVFDSLFENTIDRPAFFKAVDKSLPDEEYRKGLETKLASEQKQLKKVNNDINIFLDKVLANKLSDKIIEKRQSELLAQQTLLEQNITELQDKIKHLPKPEVVKAQADKIRQKLRKDYGSKKRLKNMSYKDKRLLLHWLFDGTNYDVEYGPRKYGIYVSKKPYKKVAIFKIFAKLFDVHKVVDNNEVVEHRVWDSKRGATAKVRSRKTKKLNTQVSTTVRQKL